jgi:hypothetical protein
VEVKTEVGELEGKNARVVGGLPVEMDAGERGRRSG